VLHGKWLFAAATLTTLMLSACSGEDLGGEKLPIEAASLQTASAEAMGAVMSVRFELERTGAPVFIDQVESISLDAIDGRFQRPGSADAILQVTVNGSLRTKLGAVAIGEEVWLSNPVTGTFETLPLGFDLDPSLFFDPEDGWRPLLVGLTGITFVEEIDRDGTTYHLRGTAPADTMQAITAGLVRGQDVELDLWLHPVTAAVRFIEFSTAFGGDTSDWALELREYGEQFEILPPEQ